MLLGQQPLANSYVRPEQLDAQEPVYPLDLYVCEDCGMCHIEVVATSEDIFSDYAYFSSFSTTWLEHAAHYVEKITARLGLGADSHVVEIASNDGYLLQFMKERGIPCMGVEPAANVAEAAVEKGIPTEVAFWGMETAERLKATGKSADLMIANNVLAHVPTLNDFVAGFKVLLKADGVATFEFPHLMELVKHRQFDTIYHEHFSYYALFTLDRNPHKQGCYLPGSLIPIYAPEHVTAVKPDYLVILPWNLKSEIMEQMAHIRDWGGKFVVAIPELEIIE